MLQSLAHLLVVAGCLLAQGLAVPAHAATLIADNPFARNDPSALFFTPECNAELNGRIYAGDAEAMAAQLKALMPRVEAAGGKLAEGRFLALCLNSRGGDLLEALKIRELFKGWMMVVPADTYCVSACAIIFMSAAPRENVFFYRNSAPGRFLHHRAHLGFHAPALVFPAAEAEAYIPEASTGEARSAAAARMAARVQAAYNDALARMRAVAFPGGQRTDLPDLLRRRQSDPPETQEQKDERYARQLTPNPIGIGGALPTELLAAFLTVPHEEAFYVSRVEQAIRWGIEIYGIAKPSALTSAMLGMACINVAAAQCLKSPNGLCYEQSTRGGGLNLVFFRLLHNQKKTLEFGYNSIGRAMQTPTTNISRLNFYQFRRTPFTLDLQPKGGATPAIENVHVEILEMLAGGTKPVCDVRAIWRDDRIVDLALEIVEGQPHDQRALHLKPAQDSVDALIKEDQSVHLKPWKMLPGFTKLSELGASSAWERLATGGNFFSKPPGW